MSIMPDKWIREMAKARGMIEPFTEKQNSPGRHLLRPLFLRL